MLKKNYLLNRRYLQVGLGQVWRDERSGLPRQMGRGRLGNDRQSTGCGARSRAIALARVLSLLSLERWNVGQKLVI